MKHPQVKVNLIDKILFWTNPGFLIASLLTLVKMVITSAYVQFYLLMGACFILLILLLIYHIS